MNISIIPIHHEYTIFLFLIITSSKIIINFIQSYPYILMIPFISVHVSNPDALNDLMSLLLVYCSMNPNVLSLFQINKINVNHSSLFWLFGKSLKKLSVYVYQFAYFINIVDESRCGLLLKQLWEILLSGS